MPKQNYRPLAGVTVLDLSRVLAGPWCTQLLADMGARVIKVERPGAGDDTRSWGPPFLTDGNGQTTDAAYYSAANRNKQSIAVDLRRPEGQALVRKLVSKCDVLVENFKVGSLAKLGLDYDSLKVVSPALVYASITGFGQTGPDARHPGYDYLVQARGGLMSVTGHGDGTPGAGPMKVGIAVADLFTGLYACTGLLAALFAARQTGMGAQVDVGLLDVQAAVLSNQATNYFASGKAPVRSGLAHPNIVPYQAFDTSDGSFVIAVGNNDQFAHLCAAIGVPEMATDPRFARNRDRVVHRDELCARLSEIFATQSTARWIKALEAVNVPCAPIHSIDQVFEDPQIQARDMVSTLTRGDGTQITTPACPIHFHTHAPLSEKADTASPQLGADADDILSEFGWSEDAIADLRRSGVIG